MTLELGRTFGSEDEKKKGGSSAAAVVLSALGLREEANETSGLWELTGAFKARLGTSWDTLGYDRIQRDIRHSVHYTMFAFFPSSEDALSG